MTHEQTLQSTSSLFMVRPVRFGFNEQTAASNAFMENDTSLSKDSIQKLALAEFDAMVETLREAGIEVTVFEDHPEPHTPDSIFPNNWISFHKNGKVILYPLNAPNRRLERRLDIPEYFMKRNPEATLIDLSESENEGRFLEGTGSMIFDRANQIAYACVSPRTNPKTFQKFCEIIGIERLTFHAADQNEQAIYHTNVMMAVGTSVAVICLESIRDSQERAMVVERLTSTGHDIVEISFEQMNKFAGNMLEVQNQEGKRYMVLSQQAYDSLSVEQRVDIEAHATLLPITVNTIESYGGGSVRCMMAEVYI